MEFAAIALTSRLCHLCQTYQYHFKTCLLSIYHRMSSLTPHLYACVTLKYIMTCVADLPDPELLPFPLVIADNSEYVEQINQFRHVQHWNRGVLECPGQDYQQHTLWNLHEYVPHIFSHRLVKAILNPLWYPPILKEHDNFSEDTCFQWIPDIGQRRLWMFWLFSFKANYDLKARMVIDGSKCIPGIDFNPDEVYCTNVTATSIKIFFALSALYGLALRGGDPVGAYFGTPI